MPAVQSLYSRILARNPAIRGNKFNLAIGGADVASMLLQAKKAVGLKPAPELVVVQGIDADIRCDTDSHKPFQVEFARVWDVLATGLPDARVFVVSQFGSTPTLHQRADAQATRQPAAQDLPPSGPCALPRRPRSPHSERRGIPRGRHPPLRSGGRDRLQGSGHLPLRRWRVRARRRAARSTSPGMSFTSQLPGQAKSAAVAWRHCKESGSSPAPRNSSRFAFHTLSNRSAGEGGGATSPAQRNASSSGTDDRRRHPPRLQASCKRTSSAEALPGARRRVGRWGEATEPRDLSGTRRNRTPA